MTRSVANFKLFKLLGSPLSTEQKNQPFKLSHANNRQIEINTKIQSQINKLIATNLT